MTLILFLVMSISLFVESNTLLYWMGFVIFCFYHAIFESSNWQATPGKRYAKVRVEDNTGHRLSVQLALARILAKFISLALMFSGFFMIYFRADRKGLHDLLCGTRVVLIGPSTRS